jgi:ParB family chromosome partitioning protein
VNPEADDLAERLADQLETRVRIDQGRSKGRIIIEYATIEDRARIVTLLGLRS